MTDAADLLSGNVGLQTGAVVMMRGEIDVFTAPYFRTLVDEGVATGAGTVTLNLASVTFMDARRLSVLVGAAQQQRKATGRASGVGAHPSSVHDHPSHRFPGVQAPAPPSPLVSVLARAAAASRNWEQFDSCGRAQQLRLGSAASSDDGGQLDPA